MRLLVRDKRLYYLWHSKKHEHQHVCQTPLPQSPIGVMLLGQTDVAHAMGL